ncbi:InlB B-repeat-containing protein, partial [Filifactor villosus]
MKKFGLRLRILCAVLSFVMIFTVGEGSLSSYADVGATINHRNTSTNVSVTYKANGGTGADIVTSVSTGSSITLAANTFGAPSGHVFDGWSVNGVKKNVGDSITIMSDTDILALWKSTATN